MSGSGARRGFAFQDLLLAERVLQYTLDARACEIEGRPRPDEPEFGVEASFAGSEDEDGPEWDLLKCHANGAVELEEVKRGEMNAADRQALWRRVRAQFQRVPAHQQQRLHLHLSLNSEKTPSGLAAWGSLAAWVSAPENEETIARFLASPALPGPVRNARDLAQEAICFLTTVSPEGSTALNGESATRLLRGFQLSLEPASELSERVERHLGELSQGLAIKQLLDWLRGAISRHAESFGGLKVFRPSQLLEGSDVLERLRTVDPHDASLWRNLRDTSRLSLVSSEKDKPALSYVDWRSVQPEVQGALDTRKPIALLGRGGMGKSTTLRRVLVELTTASAPAPFALLFDATQLAFTLTSPSSNTSSGTDAANATRLRDALTLGAFVARTNRQELIVGVDALETLGDQNSIVALLSSLAACGPEARVLVSCRATTWNQLRSSQQSMHGWAVAELSDWPIERVLEAVKNPSDPKDPGPGLLNLLRTPLFLDLFLRVAVDDRKSLGTTSSRRGLLDQYWRQRVLPGMDSRSVFRRQLLRHATSRTVLGDESHALPTDASPGVVAALDDLASEGLFTISRGTFQFRHALLSDFAISELLDEADEPLHVLCTIRSHFVRLGAMQMWLEGIVGNSGRAFARLARELEQLDLRCQADLASSLGQLENVGSVDLLALSSGMDPGRVPSLLMSATRAARFAGNMVWLDALASLPGNSQWAQDTVWLDREFIIEVLELLELASSSSLELTGLRRLAENVREWLSAPKLASALAEFNGWLQGRAFSVIGRAAPTDETLRWLIRRGGIAGSPGTMITSTLRDIVDTRDPPLDSDLLVAACLVGAGLRREGRRLQWQSDRHNWMGLQPYLLGEGPRAPKGWLETHLHAFLPVAVGLIAGFEWDEYQKFCRRDAPDFEALLAELKAAEPATEPSDSEKQATALIRNRRSPDGDELDVVPQLTASVWKDHVSGPCGLLEWLEHRAIESLGADGHVFDQSLWPAVRDGASLACKIVLLKILAPAKGQSARPALLASMLRQPALYRSPDAHPYLQRAIRLRWPVEHANDLLDCILSSARDPGAGPPNVWMPGPLLFAIPDAARPKDLEPFLVLHREAGLSLELEVREPKTSRVPVGRPRHRRRPRLGGLRGKARTAWKRLLALPDATITSTDVVHVSQVLAALRELLTSLSKARDLIGVDGGPRRLKEVIRQIADKLPPKDWPLTLEEIEHLWDWAVDGLRNFSETELDQHASPFDGSGYALDPLVDLWLMLAEIGDLLLRAFPSDIDRHNTFFAILNERLTAPADTLALGVLLHVGSWFRANGAGKPLLRALLVDRVRNVAVLRFAVWDLRGFTKVEQRTILDDWLQAFGDPAAPAQADFLRELAQFVGGQALLRHEDDTPTAGRDVLYEVLERRPTTGLLGMPEPYLQFLTQSIFGAKETVIRGRIPGKLSWDYAAQMTAVWRALLREPAYEPMQGPAVWIFLPIFEDQDPGQPLHPPDVEWRQWWAALSPLAQAVLESGAPPEIQWVLKGLAGPRARKHLKPDETLELLELFRTRTSVLTLDDLQSVQWWYQTIEAACEVAEGLSRLALDARERHQLLDIVRDWAGPPLYLDRAAQATHVVRTAEL